MSEKSKETKQKTNTPVPKRSFKDMSLSNSRKHKRHGSEEHLPPAKRESRTGTKRPHPKDEDEDSSAMEDSYSEMELSQLQTQDLKEGQISFKEADVGILEKVILINFMCHEKLELAFSPNVNFILGRNGSGKSAIMTGVVVALGGKARSTERGSSLKQFIRTGCRSAEVIVHLRNRGHDAYNHDGYGDTIICERQIREDGTTNYKVRSKKGKVVSTKKEELDAITDHCGIQIDNPVSLLNQDTSRNFLHNSKPGAKYKLFMKATHLEQIAQDYQHSKEEQTLMGERIEAMKLSLPALRDEAKRLEEKVESFKKFSEMESKIEELENELKWAIVTEMEATIPPIEADIVKENARVPRNETRAKTAQNGVNKAKEEIKMAQKCIEDLSNEATQVSTERNVITGEKRDKTRELRDKQSVLSRINKDITNDQKEKAALDQARQDCIKASQRDIKGEKDARLREQQELEEKIRRVEGEIATCENERTQFDAALRRAHEQLNTHKSKEKTLEGLIAGSREQLNRLQSSRNDKLAAFGPDMRALVNELHRNAHRFRCPPKGPIGSMISLKDYKWSTAVEQSVKYNTLRAFAVDNATDAVTFKSIAKRVIRKGPIPDAITSAFQGSVYNVSRNRVQTSHPSVYDMMIVDDHDVMNVLIDQCHVESILLIEDRGVANRAINHERLAREAYTIAGDQILPGRHYSNKRGSNGIIQASVDDTIKVEKEKLSHLQEDHHVLKQGGQTLSQDVSTNNQHLAALGGKIRRKLGEKKKLSSMLTRVMNQREEEEEPEEDTATYESEIAELEDKIAARVTERKTHDEVIAKVKSELEEINQRARVSDTKVEQVAGRMEELKTRLNEGDQKKKHAEKRLQTCKERLAEIQANISSLESKLVKQQNAIAEAISTAEDGCERIETDKSRKNIASEIKTLRRHIDEDQPSVEVQEAVVKEYSEAMESYQKQMALHKQMRKTIRELKISLHNRISNYQRLQERVASRACHFFTFFLRQRDYDGKIKFDHQKEQLIISVKTDSHTEQSQATSNTKALSGGERSYTTVCFIMALWDAIQAPFRCLDEFDVFMDMMNRRISMRMMMELAEAKPTRQFVFFTPQDMSSMGVSGSKMVKVLRLREPVRGGQSTLD